MLKGLGDTNGRALGFEVEFPDEMPQTLAQDEEWCIVREGNETREVRFHNYHEVYQTPGLYEHLFCRKLECNSPSVVASLLEAAVKDSDEDSSGLSVLDLGAGNGMMGQELRNLGVKSIVGVDIIPEAAQAAERDRPGVYSNYYVVDLAEPGEEVREELQEQNFNCLTTVAALGFGDIPPRVFAEAFNLVTTPGWLAFNIKEVFLRENDESGFNRLISGLVADERLEFVSRQRYRHRLSVSGNPLYYTAFVARKHGDIPAAWVEDGLASEVSAI